MSNSMGIAMVGCGQIADAHLKGVAACDRARLAFCVDVDPKRAQDAAERYGAPRWSADYAEALSDPDVDAVVLCLPHDLHVSFTVQAAEAGKHILVEKPMALNEGEARDMVAAAEMAEVQLSVGQSTRYMPPFQHAKKVLSEGQIGPVVQVMHQRTFWVEKVSTDWRRSMAACGGLYLPLFGSHDVDAMLWLLEDTPERVWGAVRARTHASDGDSDGFIGLEFGDGKIGSISFSVRSKHTRAEMLFVGEEGSLAVQRNRLLLDGEAVDMPEYEPAFVAQMRAFVDALAEGREAPTQGRDVVRVMRVLDLVREASASGQSQVF